MSKTPQPKSGQPKSGQSKTGQSKAGPSKKTRVKKAPARKSPPKLSIREPDREPRAQFAALPWRHTPGGEVEVLLITSRETRRWVIPKGWPIKGKTSAKSAAQEAFEEAGVRGKVAKGPVGAYAYDKRLKNGRLQHVRVAVFALQVESEAEAYPELGQREKRWLPVAEAATLVDEPELMVVLATFKPGGSAA